MTTRTIINYHPFPSASLTHLNPEHIFIDRNLLRRAGSNGNIVIADVLVGCGRAVRHLVAEELPVERGRGRRPPDDAEARARRADLVGEEFGGAARA